jgi:hypothetical protein
MQGHGMSGAILKQFRGANPILPMRGFLCWILLQKKGVALPSHECNLPRSMGGYKMNFKNVASIVLASIYLSGCASTCPPGGARGPEIVASGESTENRQYAEVGVEFSTWGDFVALVSPNRWKSPVSTGGSLSWLNPGAWREDSGRTGRILLGEAVVVGGVVAATGSSSGGGSGSSASDGSGTSTPTPPSGDVPSAPGF